VGHDPDALSPVRSPDRPSTHHKRPDGVSFTLQVRADSVDPSSAESTDVLSKYPTGSKLSHKPGELGPKPGAGAADSFPLAGDADILTGESSTNEIGLQPSQSVCCELSDIFPDGDFGPVLSEDFSGEGFNLAESNGFIVSCALKAKTEPSYAAEQV
jgi:hypothetical protein